MTEEPTRGISRRTLAKGVAWSVPAVAVASAVPAYAASPGIITFIGQNCKLPGSSTVFKNGAVYLMNISNTTAAPIEIDITSVIRGGVSQPGSETTVVKLSGTSGCCTALGNTFTVPVTSTATYALVTRDWGNSANETLTVNFELDGVPQAAVPATVATLNPFTTNSKCGIGGSCTLISEARKQCILQALLQPGCAGHGCS